MSCSSKSSELDPKKLPGYREFRAPDGVLLQRLALESNLESWVRVCSSLSSVWWEFGSPERNPVSIEINELFRVSTFIPRQPKLLNLSQSCREWSPKIKTISWRQNLSPFFLKRHFRKCNTLIAHNGSCSSNTYSWCGRLMYPSLLRDGIQIHVSYPPPKARTINNSVCYPVTVLMRNTWTIRGTECQCLLVLELLVAEGQFSPAAAGGSLLLHSS